MLAAVLTGAASMVRSQARSDAPAHSMDETTFQAFYERTSRCVWSYVPRLSGNPSVADDCLQEAYMRFLKANIAGRSDAECKSYLYRIATNLVTDHYRKVRREVEEPADIVSPERLGDDVQQRSDVQRVFGQLNEKERGLLWMAYVDGSSHR